MKLSEIQNHCDYSRILPTKLTVWTEDGEDCATIEMEDSDPDFAVLVEVRGNVIRIANRDIPNFIEALSLFCREDFF